jgi:hypothetical protein
VQRRQQQVPRPRSEPQRLADLADPRRFARALHLRVQAPAPHATREWKFYVTRDGWQPGSPLRWADLQEFCTLGNVPLSGDVYKLDCPLPKRSGQHIIYNTWQRSDSGKRSTPAWTCASKAAVALNRRRSGRTPARSPPAVRWKKAPP